MFLKLILFTTLANLALARPDKGRIIGGSLIDIKLRQFQVALLVDGELSCGGSIIGNTKIVTAAQCVVDKTPDQIKIRAGSSIYNSGGAVYDVSAISIHPGFDSTTFYYDVAVLTTSFPIKFTPLVKKIPLALKRPADGTNCTVSGWGATEEGGEVSDYLMAVDVPIVPQSVCQKVYGGPSDIINSMICAGLPYIGGKDSCTGDAGGPLTIGKAEKLVGIVSFGAGCAKPEAPGVYASVPELRKWILDQ